MIWGIAPPPLQAANNEKGFKWESAQNEWVFQPQILKAGMLLSLESWWSIWASDWQLQASGGQKQKSAQNEWVFQPQILKAGMVLSLESWWSIWASDWQLQASGGQKQNKLNIPKD